MTSLLKILILISTLTTTSYALSCTQCVSVFSSTCSGDKVTCPFGSFCGSINMEIIIGGFPINLLIRDCMASPDCDLKASMSINYGQVKRVTSCCDTDNCTPTIPAFSAKSSKPNGVVCRIPAPSGLSNWFSNANTIQCRGDEDVCVLQKSKLSGSTSISIDTRACGTRTICDLSDHLYDFDGISVEFQYICSKDKEEF
ncbi:uncharacterized protein LOC120992272 isoform X2 [Bufo bufo]|uniref:uncharacterized protein LOC120992272 isoform X2 n=1 Tax=Bufo bufo TaxID=8384 RepID=UPI001ABE7933|nr:uncharacterized protein LOC120992272 isoform X2 [Bufo bufo]